MLRGALVLTGLTVAVLLALAHRPPSPVAPGASEEAVAAPPAVPTRRSLHDVELPAVPLGDLPARLDGHMARHAARTVTQLDAERRALELADRELARVDVMARDTYEDLRALRAWIEALKAPDAPAPSPHADDLPDPGAPEAEPKAGKPKGKPTPAEVTEAELVLLLRTHRDFYVRMGAAYALGQRGAVGAVPALVAALDDRDDLVRTTASDALTTLTGHAIAFDARMRRAERARVQRAWLRWWRKHESAVRERFDADPAK